MLALCIGRTLGAEKHFGEVADAIADADPGREFACKVCGARLASFALDTPITFEPTAIGFQGVVATYLGDATEDVGVPGWVYLTSAAQGRILAPINRLVVAA
jgi:hypothetical protein